MSASPDIVANAVSREQPWPGLMPFTEDAQAFFHGRDQEAAELLRLIKRETLTVLFGQSGLGKSSLLNAGLFPRLRSEGFLPVYVRLDVSPMAPRFRQQVYDALMTVCRERQVDAPEPLAYSTRKLTTTLKQPTLWEYFHRKDTDIWSSRNRLLTPVIVLDQFEEVFTLGERFEDMEQRCRRFLEELADLVEDRAPAEVTRVMDEDAAYAETLDFSKRNYKVVLSFREDYLAEFEGLRGLIRSIMQNRLRLTRMNGEQAREAILQSGGHLVSPEVAEQVIRFVAAPRAGARGDDDLARLEIEPALLSVVCRELNNQRLRRGQSHITGDMLLAGAQQQIIRDFYESSVEGIDTRVREFVEDQLLTEAGFRDSYAYDDALALPGVTREAIDRLIARRLLRLEERSGVLRVELTHDLLTQVARESRDRRQKLDAERRAREADAVRRRRSRRFAAIGVSAGVGALALAVVFGVLLDRSTKEKQRLIETQSYVLLGQAVSGMEQQLAGEPQANLAQALRLYPANDGAVARTVSWMSQRPHARFLWKRTAAGALSVNWRSDGQVLLAQAQGPVLLDARRALATEGVQWFASGDDHEDYGLVRPEWRSRVLPEASATGASTARSIVFSSRQVPGAHHGYQPRARTLSYTGRSAVLHLFDAETLKPVGRAVQLATQPVSVEASPGRKWVAAAFRDGSVRLAAVDGSAGGILAFPRDRVPGAGRTTAPPAIAIEAVTDAGIVIARTEAKDVLVYAFDSARGLHLREALGRFEGPLRVSYGGRMLALARRNEVVMVPLNGDEADRKPIVHPMRVLEFAFSPDDRRLATGSIDKHARVWDLQSRALVVQPFRHEDAVRSVSFSLDGATLATGALDGSARVWSIATGQPLLEPVVHGEAVIEAVQSPDRSRLLTLTATGRLTLWEISGARMDQERIALGADGSAFAASPDERRVAVGTRAGDVLVVNVAVAGGGGTAVAWKRSLGARPVTALRYSGDGRRVAAVFADGRVEILDAQDGRSVVPALRSRRAPIALEFSADGTTLAAAFADRTLRVWQIEPRLLVRVAARNPVDVAALRLSANGRDLLIGGIDGSVRLIDARTLAAVATHQPAGAASRIALVEWTVAGQGAIVVTDREILHLGWTLKEGDGEVAAMRVLGRADIGFKSWTAALSTDRRRLLVGGLDGSARLFDLQAMRASGEAMRHSATVLEARFSRDGRWATTVAADRSVRVWDGRSGFPVADPVAQSGDPVGASLAGGGNTLVMAGGSPELLLQRLALGFPQPAPAWLPQLIEAAGGIRVDEHGTVSTLEDREARLEAVGRAAREGAAGWWQDWAGAILSRLLAARGGNEARTPS